MKLLKGKIMIYVWIALGLIVGLILVVQIGGAMLPVKHTVTVSKSFPAPPERVWEVLTDIEGMPKWRKELISIRRTEGEHAWVEKSKFGEMPLQAEVFEPPKRMVARIMDKKLPFGGAWTYELTPEGNGTKLTITENGEVYSPMFRFMSKYIFGYSKTIETYLSQLESHLKTEAP